VSSGGERPGTDRGERLRGAASGDEVARAATRREDLRRRLRGTRGRGRKLRGLVVLLAPYRSRVALMAIALVAGTAASLAPAPLAKTAIDSGILKGDRSTLDFVVVAFMASALIVWGASYAQTYLVGWVGQRALTDLRLQIFRHLQEMPVGFYERRPAGVLISRMTNDVEALDSLVTDTVVTLFQASLTLVGSIAILLFLDARLALLTFLIFPVMAIASLAFRIASADAYRRTRETISAITAYLQETLSGIRVVRAFAQEPRHRAQFGYLNDVNRDANMVTVNLNAAYFPGVEFISALATVGILIVGGRQAINGDIEIGVLVGFLAALNGFFDPIGQLSQVYTTYQSGMAALDKIFELLDEQPQLTDAPDAIVLPRIRGEIRFEDVSFRYRTDEGTKLALDGVSLTVPPGQTVALVGATGAGKSTFAKLVARFYDPTDGRVLVDGHDLRDVAARARRAHKGVGAPERDVLADRAAEQERLLRHDPHLRAQRGRGHVAQVVAVDQDAPRGRVIEARDQLGERRLAGAGRAHERDRLARRDLQCDICQSVRARPVAERHVVEHDLAAQARQVDSVRRVDEVGLLVEQLEDLVERRHPRLVGRIELRKRLDRVEEVVQRGEERDEHADRDVPVERLDPAVEQDPRGHQPAHQLDAREVGGVQVDRPHVRAAVLLVELREALQVARLLSERAHDANPRQRLLQVGGDRRDLLARRPVGVGGDDPERERAEPEDREHEVGQQRELRVEQEQDHRGADEHQRGAEQRHDAVGDERVERLDVVGQARDQHAGAAARIEADRHPLQVREQLDPQVLQRALADPADEVGLHVACAPVHERGAEEGDNDPGQRRQVARHDALVDRQLGQRRRRELGAGGQHERDEHQHDLAAIRLQQRREAAQLAPAARRRAPAADDLVAAGGGHLVAHSSATRSRGSRCRNT
jgi:ABC-type multidrug transport system fused ATPase/permease subunit